MVDSTVGQMIAPLFVPADRPDRYSKAQLSGADAIVIDLEDAVAAANKDRARDAFSNAVLPQCTILVRINHPASPWFAQDVAAVADRAVAGIIVPKADRNIDLRYLRSKIHTDMAIVFLIETALGLSHARELGERREVNRFAFGSIDFCADLGCAHSREALLGARCELVLASRLGEMPGPIDGVTTSVKDLAVVEADAHSANELGFSAKFCIHPHQVAAVYRGFAPSSAEVEWAQKIVAAGTGGAVLVDGAMVDAPVLLRASRILARSRNRQS